VPLPAERDIHIWSVPLDVDAEALPRLNALLCEEEQARARRYVFERDRRRFVAARAALRINLGRYLDLPGDEVRFEYGPAGKPYLKGEGRRTGLRFNVSHSHALALIAVCAGEEPGVDIELVREMDDMESIVRRFFCPEEIEQWVGLPGELRTRAFFDCWTRKEAYVKAVGDGLLMPLDRFQVSFRPGEAPGIRLYGGGNGQQWSIFDVRPSTQFAGALAIEGSGWQLRFCGTFADWNGGSTAPRQS
jgi:4'-phosphopantetheinyl transferase